MGEGTSGTVIALSTVVSVLACCGVLLFLYRRRYGQKEEDEKELSPYERWMRNEENKGGPGMDQGNFRMSGGQGMDVTDIYGNNSTHNPMGGSPGGMDYYGNPQMMQGMQGMQGGDPRMSGMSNMSGGNMVMMPNPGMDPRMSGMSNPGMMPPQGMNGSTHNPMMGSGGQDS